MVQVMKDSGVEWIKEIPTEWEVRRCGEFFRQRDGRGSSNGFMLTVSIEHGVLPQAEYEVMSGRRLSAPISQKDNYRIVRPGDLIYNKMRMWQGAVGLSRHHGVVSPAYVVLRSRSAVIPGFYDWLFKSDLFVWQSNLFSYGIADDQNSLRFEDFKSMTLLYPSLNVQRRISTWLDLQTSRIDKRIRLLGEKRALLLELRRNVLAEVIASGLAAQGREATGLPDLPQLPIGWTPSQAKRLLRFITSGSRGWAEYYADEGDLFLRIGNLTRETIGLDLSDVQYVALPAKAAEGKRTRIREGDMLVSITADLGSIAVAPKLDKPAYVNQHIALCRPKDGVHPRWLGYAMLSRQSKQQMMNSGYGGTKVQLSLDDVRNVWLAVPPFDEQREIAAYLDQRLDKIARQIVLIDRLETLLKEQRKALIHEAVTGKIDLSNYEPPAQAA